LEKDVDRVKDDMLRSKTSIESLQEKRKLDFEINDSNYNRL
jgi:hypothetical protein